MNPELALLGIEPHERIFKRDCLEIDVRIGGKPLTLFVSHFKSMGSPRNGMDGRASTMPVRIAEATGGAPDHRRQICDKWRRGDKRWVICGDFNDYRERIVIGGDSLAGYTFAPVSEPSSSLDILLDDGFCENLVERRPVMDRWTLYHTRGPKSAICASSTIFWPRRHSHAAMPLRSPILFAAVNHTGPYFRPIRR